MTVARESRRGGAQVASDSASAAAAALARSAEIQRQLNLTASEKKHFELVCEVKPDWNDSEIVSFLQKCNYNSNVINDALMNAFEDLRPSEDQNAADWNVQSKKSKRKPKDKGSTPGEQQPADRRPSGPRARSERFEHRDRTEKPERRERSERWERKEQSGHDRRPKRDFNKAEGAAPKPQSDWGSSTGNWGEAQSTLPSDSGAWASSTAPAEPADSWSSPAPATDAGAWADSTTQPESKPEPVAPTEPAPSKPETSSSSSPAVPATSSPQVVEGKPKPTAGTLSWADMTKRNLTKQQTSSPPVMPASKPAVEPETKPAPTNWGQEEVVGQWGAPEPALAADAAADETSTPEAPEAEPEQETTTAPVQTEPVVPPPPKAVEMAPPVESVPAEPSTDDLLSASDPVILPQFVAQQVAGLNATMIKFGTISIDDESEMISPNAECVRIHSAQADFQQQVLHQEHEISEDIPADIRARHDYETMPMYAQYPPFLNSIPSYMPYDADTTTMPAYFEPYNQQQRVQRPRQQSYGNARNNKMRRDHRNAAGNPRHPQPEDFPAQALSSNEQPANTFPQGMPEREPQGTKQSGVERSGTGGPRGTKQRQSDRSRGGLTGAYHHPSYAAGHIPVGYGQPYGYPAPYLPQFYGQNQQGYGPPGFRQHYSQYQSGSNYQPYQSGIPRSAYMGQTDYVDSTGMHIGQHQGEPGPTLKASETEHVSPDPSVLYPFEHQAWPDQHRYLLQQQQPHQAQNNESNVIETAPEGGAIQHSSFDRRNDGSPSQPASFGYGGQQYSQAHSYQNFSNQHQYNDSSNRSYPHWASHQ